MKFFLEFLSRVRFFIVLALILLPAPLFGGGHTAVIFGMRGLVLFGFLLVFLPFLLGQPAPSLDFKVIRAPLAIFSIFLLYLFVQIRFGAALFNAAVPGTIQVHDTTEQVFQLVFYLLFFLLCLEALSSRKRIRFLTFLMAFEVVFLVGLGYYQKMNGINSIYGFYNPLDTQDIFSSFVVSNHYGMFLFLAGFFFLGALAYCYDTAGRKLRSDLFILENIFYFSLLAVMMASSFYAEARAAFLSQILMTVFFFLAVLSGKKKIRGLLMFFGLAAFGLFFVKLAYPKVITQTYYELPAQLLNRALPYREAYKVLSDFPIFGTGLGAYKWLSKSYQFSFLTEYFWMDHASNDHLELLVETGFPGYTLFMLSFVSLIIPAFGSCLKSPSHWCRINGLAAFSAVLAIGAL